MTPSPRVNVQFFEDGHRYLLGGKEAPSVTRILGAEGMTDYSWCEDRHRDRGSKVHRIAQLISRGWCGSTVEEVVRNSRWDPAKTTPEIVGYGYAAAKFLLKTGFQPILVEQPVGSTGLEACGTLDAVGKLPSGEILLPDYKSGRPAPAVWLQLNLYAFMLEETYGIKADLLAPVWLQKDGDFQQWPPKPPGGEDLTIAISAVNCYRWRVRHKLL